jgi:hypothetical protein
MNVLRKQSATESGLQSASCVERESEHFSLPTPRRFDFECDTFTFANELIWEYRFDSATGKTTFTQRTPKPDYAHRCFVLTAAARQFLYHARFEPDKPVADDETYPFDSASRDAQSAHALRTRTTGCDSRLRQFAPVQPGA